MLVSDLWLMERNAMRQMVDMATRGIHPNAEHVRTAAAQSAPRRQGKIAIIPVTGPLEARPTAMGAFFGMTSYHEIGTIFDAQMRDETVGTIVLDVASPGGQVWGAQELAAKIYKARGGQKRIVAVANPMAASGAYWIASAAERMVSIPSGDVGSIGVIIEHLDFSKSLENDGVRPTVIRSTDAPRKVEAHPYEPLSDDAREHLQSRADAIHRKFVADIAKHRGVSVGHVNEYFGQGRTVDAKAAVAAGMIDREMTLEDLVTGIISGRVKLGGATVQDVWEAPSRTEELRQKAAEIVSRSGQVFDR